MPGMRFEYDKSVRMNSLLRFWSVLKFGGVFVVKASHGKQTTPYSSPITPHLRYAQYTPGAWLTWSGGYRLLSGAESPLLRNQDGLKGNRCDA